MQVKKDLQLYGISEVITATKALLNERIAAVTDDEILNTLKGIFVMIGLRAKHIPCDDEKVFLINFIREQYGRKTLAEIQLAFKLALHGSLDLPIDEVNPYDQFSCIYLAKIMERYKRWLKATYDSKESIVSRNLLVNKVQAEISMQEKMTEKDWDEMLNMCRSGGLCFDLLPVIVYDHFSEVGKIKFTPAEKNYYLRKAVEYYGGKLAGDISFEGNKKYAIWNKMREEMAFEGEIVSHLITIAKRFALLDFLNPPTCALPPKKKEKISDKKVK